MKTKHAPSLFRIIIRRNHIWLPELTGLLLVGILIASILMLGITVVVNDRAVHANHTIISNAKTERMLLSTMLTELKEKLAIATVLESSTGIRLSEELKWNLTELIYANSKTFGYDPLLVIAVIKVESRFNPGAKGKFKDGNYSGAFGLMQLKTETAREVADALGIPFQNMEDLFNPEINIPLGIAYLTKQISRFKSLKLGISAYNQGPGVVLSTIKNKQALSINYYNKVLDNYFALKRIVRTAMKYN